MTDIIYYCQLPCTKAPSNFVASNLRKLQNFEQIAKYVAFVSNLRAFISIIARPIRQSGEFSFSFSD